jgi:hypothetical protein
MWEEKSKGALEYNCDEGATREVTNIAWMLVAFTTAGVLERIFRANIHDGVTEVAHKPQQLPLLLQFMKDNKSTISYADFAKLYPLHAHSKLDMWQFFDFVLSCVDKKAVPTLEDAAIFTSVVKEHGWNAHTKPILSIFESSFPFPLNTNSYYLYKQVSLLHEIESVEHNGNLDDLFSNVITDYVTSIVKGQRESFWENKEIVSFLFRRGKPSHFQSLREWVLKASLAILTQLLQQLKSGDTSSSTEAEEAFRKLVNDRWKSLQIASLQERKRELGPEVRGGKPEFSWSMPAANTSNSALNDFLRSDQEGPTKVVTGGGIHTARKLESYGPKYYFTENLLQKGFSAKIVAEGDGDDAGVVVTKTRDYYNVFVCKYEQDFKALEKVKEELRELGVEPDEPDAKRARTDEDDVDEDDLDEVASV